MAIGIFGLPSSGKTTIFNAATRGATTHGHAGPNIGVVKVPDERLARLTEISKPKRIVHAEIEYLDIPAATGRSPAKGTNGAQQGSAC